MDREQSGSHVFTGEHNFHAPEKTLTNMYVFIFSATDSCDSFKDKQSAIHEAFCDSFNTPNAMSELRSLISSANTYYQDCVKSKSTPNATLLVQIGEYVTKILRMLGVFSDTNPSIGGTTGSSQDSGFDREAVVFPFVETLSQFRDKIRSLAQAKASHSDFLKLCDELRDSGLIDLGVSLEDREDGRALVKLVDPKVLLAAREEKRLKEEEKARDKAERARIAEAKRIERLQKGALSPFEMFKVGEYATEFSAWDPETGFPTLDKEGQELAKSRRKKLEKEASVQGKLHQEYLVFVSEEAAKKAKNG